MIIMGCSTKNISKIVQPTKIDFILPRIQVVNDPYLKKSNKFITSYIVTVNECKVVWQITGNKKGCDPYHLLLRYGTLKNKCRSFNEQNVMHKYILDAIFSNYDKKRFKTFNTGPLSLIDPTYILNIKIADRSMKNLDWLDYVKNYPNHKSEKSSNDIFLEIARQTNVFTEINNLFKEFGFRLNLKFVEKVFAQHFNKLVFKDKLYTSQFKYRVMYDAGSLDFELISLK